MCSVDKHFSESFFFSEDWFGPVAGNDQNDMEKRLQGRWSDVEISRNVSNPTQSHNSYGILTQAINNNPSIYVTRCVCVCADGVCQCDGLTPLRSLGPSPSAVCRPPLLDSLTARCSRVLSTPLTWYRKLVLSFS